VGLSESAGLETPWRFDVHAPESSPASDTTGARSRIPYKIVRAAKRYPCRTEVLKSDIFSSRIRSAYTEFNGEASLLHILSTRQQVMNLQPTDKYMKTALCSHDESHHPVDTCIPSTINASSWFEVFQPTSHHADILRLMRAGFFILGPYLLV